MAFTTKIQQTATATDCQSFTIADATGNGATGYGGSNPPVTDVNVIQVLITLPNETTPVDVYELTGTDAEDLMSGTTDLEVNSEVLGLTGAGQPLTELESGLYYVSYTPFFDTPSTVSVTNGSATVTGTFNNYVTWGMTSVLIGGERYEVQSLTNSTLTLTEVYTGTTSGTATWYAGFEAVMVNSAGATLTSPYATEFCPIERGLQQRLVEAYTSGCSCESKRVMNATQYTDRYRYGVIQLYNCGSYEQCQALVNQIARWLDREGCCGC